ncbi:PaREP1 family protein [Sulfolobus acidocaldarius]|uniref:PaREP1 family protein n=1 Tax=Sulfolobus acidocaldarius TaxID=2285 RepID=UPI0009BDF40C
MSSSQIRSLILEWIREADELLEKGDIVQASEKYYKAAEEAIKLVREGRHCTSLREILQSSRRGNKTTSENTKPKRHNRKSEG